MKTQNIHSVGLFPKRKLQSSFETSQYLNLPDLQFFIWCNQQYGVNKGVYNTIEQSFYENGIINIHNRRIHIMAFLDFVKDEKQDQLKFIHFGHGGLTRKMKEFLNVSGQSGNVIPLER
jgi:riboflavin kinase